jgi:predicted enzyme related to lactoylglutathione lyase
MPRISGARYRHTNLIARDWTRLAGFYERVFGCTRVPPERHLQGDWLERASGVKSARLTGVHLRLPGCGPEGPTLEIFQYAATVPQELPVANRAGYGHLAFAVPDVDAALGAVVAEGGSALGEVVTQAIEGAGTIRFTYARDPEGNILELQAWS